MTYVFDIDGTLTPSRLPMDINFQKWFSNFAEENTVWLITGSDKDKTIEQIGETLWLKVERAYQSCGNELYESGKLTYVKDLRLPPDYINTLQDILDKSEYTARAGNHIEFRTGLVNFSIVGRQCTQEQRENYYEWDKDKKERETICKFLNKTFTEYEAVKGGQISIDIYEKGNNKGQIVEHIKGPFTFFGDHLHPGGNDYAVKQVADKIGRTDCIFHSVKSWEDTFKILKEL